MSEPSKAPSGDTWAHRPLPYVVRLRVSTDDDKPSVRYEHRCLAYSLLEALIQASVAATGQATIDNQKVAVERLEPDWEAYLTMMHDATEAEMSSRKAASGG